MKTARFLLSFWAAKECFNDFWNPPT
jgi:hypothetical protein